MECETGANDPEINVQEELARFRAMHLEYFRKAAVRARRSLVALAAASLFVAPFVRGMPLHAWYRPYGRALAIVWTVVLAVAVVAVLDTLTDRPLRRELDRITL